MSSTRPLTERSREQLPHVPAIPAQFLREELHWSEAQIRQYLKEQADATVGG